jgi:hypothetical protein
VGGKKPGDAIRISRRKECILHIEWGGGISKGIMKGKQAEWNTKVLENKVEFKE